MPLILIIIIVILTEQLTHKTALELAMLILSKIWAAIEWFILFLLKMNEPPGSKS